MAGTLGTGTLHFTVSQPLIRSIILHRSLSRTSCQSNLELRREKHTGGGGGGLRWRNCPGGATRSHSPSALKGTHGSARLLDRGSNCASEEDVEVKVTQSCLTLCDPMDYNPDQNTGVGSRSLLQGIIPTQRLNQGLRHCRRILYQLSHQESLKRILLHR